MSIKKDAFIHISSWIIQETELSPLEMLVLSIIESLDRENHCYATNEFFAEMCHSGVSTITRAIKNLSDNGYIETSMVNCKKGTERLIKMRRGVSSNRGEGCPQNEERIIYNNIYNKNININTISPQEKIGTVIFSNRIIYKSVKDQVYALSCEYGEEVRNRLCNIVDYFYNKYYYCFGENHPRLTDETMKRCIDKLYYGSDNFEDSINYDDAYLEIIDRYFDKEFTVNVDYHFPHFCTEGIIDILSYQYLY